MSTNLFAKYDVPAPRYTSYPTVPYWSDPPQTDDWIGFLKKTFTEDKTPWSMYMHIPFCETLCTYCGCNTSITKNHERELPYLNRILQEWKTYIELVPDFKTVPLRQFHLGGGTPTFLSPENLGLLVSSIYDSVTIDEESYEGSVEVDPRKTTDEHLRVLRDLKFNRISLGVQDFNSETQRLIHRVQPYEITERLTKSARDMGYDSVNFDLIYGLPKQTKETIGEMMDLTIQLKPDRIALYSLAIVPWIKPAQRLFKIEDLPQGEEKRELYEISRKRLLDAGYIEIGMDHFSLPTDELTIAAKNGNLHRNFMGYVDFRTQVLLGLGVSAISETPYCFHQNEKALPVYERRVDSKEIPTLRGHILTAEDRQCREQILQFMTKGSVELSSNQSQDLREFLSELDSDGLVNISEKELELTQRGRPFLRNACMGLDMRLRKSKPETQVFSKSL